MTTEVIDMLPGVTLSGVSPSAPVVQSPAASGPMSMAMQALSMGVTIADLYSLLALQKDYEANEARKAYVADMAAFKINPPEILKDKHVSFTTQKGTTSYDHATIGNVCDQIIKAAADHGFSHRWIPSKGQNGELIISCEITHRLGHVELTTLEGPRDDSGTKNVLQANQSTRTYLQRHSLLMAFGFATKDVVDDDGWGSNTTVDDLKKEDQAATVLKEWIASAKATTTHDDLTRVRDEGCAAFGEVKDLAGWEALKAAIKEHRTTLPAKAENP